MNDMSGELEATLDEFAIEVYKENFRLKKRILALEGVVADIRDSVELAESGKEQDLYNHYFFVDVKEALKKLEEV